MRKKIIIMAACLLMSVLASACSPTLQTVEVTRVAPQTVVVTQLVTQIVRVNITTTPIPADTPVPGTPTPLPTDTPGSDILTPLPTQVLDMSKQQDGSIVILQYYTLLDMHLYDQAWQLLSIEYQTPANTKNFFEVAPIFYKVVKVLQIIPGKERELQLGRTPTNYYINKYWVEVYGEGYGIFQGANVNGTYWHLIQVMLENNEWKITEFPGS